MLIVTATSNIVHETENDKMLGSIEIWAQVTMKSIKFNLDMSNILFTWDLIVHETKNGSLVQETENGSVLQETENA